MKSVQLKPKAAQRVKQGYPLLVKKDFQQPINEAEGTIVKCLDQSNEPIAVAYLAKQNKGDGWVLSLDPTVEITVSFFEHLFEQAFQDRKVYQLDEKTTAYRLFNGEGDGMGGLTVDKYDTYAVFSWYSEGIYKHRQPIIEAFLNTAVDIKGIYQKFRYKRKDGIVSEHVWGEAAPEPLLIKENNVQFATYLNEGLMTGIFLDQHDVRRDLMEHYSVGKSILNTFSYTGAFSVVAAMGGASKTVSVDLANRSLAKTREQFQVNGLNLEDHLIRVMDVFDYFRYAVRKNLRFDTVIVDPPSFARSKKRTFSVAKDYSILMEDIIDVTKENGVIIASTNAAAVSPEKFLQQIDAAFISKKQSYSLLEMYRLPLDFKVDPHFEEGNYLKVCVIQKER
ncbi:MAG: class I SAM-dependent rRNA methyltransferase [Pisciglobus halotolerans]|nr:class I SAM-dependent rRNA methyltransferase [Pisciglobus halotolerans]